MNKASILIISALLLTITSCSKSKAHISSEEGGAVGVEISVPGSKDKSDVEKKENLTYEQEKELSSQLGIILPGKTKQEVK